MYPLSLGPNPDLAKPDDWCALIRNVMDSLSEQVAVLDMQGRILAVNQSWWRFAQENGGDLSGQPGSQNYLHICENAQGDCYEEGPRTAEGIRMVLSGAVSCFRLEYPCHSPRQKRWFLMQATPLYDDGTIQGAVVSHLLITDRVLAEARSRESEARLNMAQRLAHVGSFQRDLATGLGTWSQELFRIFGHEPDAFAPCFQDFLAHVHPGDRDRVAALFAKGRKSGEAFRSEFRILPFDAEERYVALVCDFERGPSGLPSRYHGAILDITERQATLEQLRLLANIDHLTGVPNRRHFLEILHSERDRALRFAQPFSVAMVDLDDFKHVNDTHGHAVGDLVLRHISRVIRNSLRTMDSLGRMGGEEFCILLPQTGLTDAREVVRRILAQVRATPLATAQVRIRQTLSCGLTVVEGEAGTQAGTLAGTQADIHSDIHADIDTLLKRADDALYRAKAAGKDRFEIHA